MENLNNPLPIPLRHNLVIWDFVFTDIQTSLVVLIISFNHRFLSEIASHTSRFFLLFKATINNITE